MCSPPDHGHLEGRDWHFVSLFLGPAQVLVPIRDRSVFPQLASNWKTRMHEGPSVQGIETDGKG